VSVPASVLEALRDIGAQLQAGQYRAAHDRLEPIVAAHPGFAEAQRLLAGAKLVLGDPAGAEALLRRAIEVDPAWAPTLTMLGELLLSNGRTTDAQDVLRRALAANSPDPRAAMVLARWYNASGRPAQALAVAAPFCAQGHLDAQLATQHVTALIALGRQSEAVDYYRRIAAAAPADPAPAQALAIALNAAGEHAQAGEVARRALLHGHKTAAIAHALAQSLMAEGDCAGAEAALRDCLRLEPRQLEAHNALAQLVWVRSGELAQATEQLDRALEMFPNDDALWAAKAAILQGAGDARAAYACLEPRAQRAQAPPSLLVRAGLAALEFEPATARSLAERALQAMPDDAAARSLLAAAELGVGDAHRALSLCEALLSRAPNNQYLIALQTTAMRLLGDERYAQLCDYRNLVLPLSIEAPEPWADVASFLRDLKTSLDRLHDPDGHALLFQSLRHGTETTRDLTRSAEQPIQALFKAFAAPINHYLEHIGHGTDPLRRRNCGRWRFNGSWSVRLRDRGFHMSHVHPRGWISSAFYIALPDSMAEARTDEGVLDFGRPSIITTPELESEYTVRPAVGMLVLFPSYFWHGTIPFASPQPRLTVAFDAVPLQ
jgi:Flp pilus assembly protein TadD